MNNLDDKRSTNRRSVERLYDKKDIMLTERLSRGIGFQVLQATKRLLL